MKKFGLTGGIASGKSSVSKTFQTLGVPVVDADVLAREAVAPGSQGLDEIIAQFGKSMLLEDGSLNRKKLGAEIFSSTSKREVLESILHPKISQLSKERFDRIESTGATYAIYEAPLLYEKDLHKEYDSSILVYLPRPTQLKRLMARDGLNEDDANLRIDSQMSLEAKRKLADFTIDNSGSFQDTKDQVVSLKATLDRLDHTA